MPRPSRRFIIKSAMSLQSKWFGFGHDERFDAGVRAFKQGRYEEATDDFAECLKSAPGPGGSRLARFYLAESYGKLGGLALRKGDPELAAIYLRNAIEIQPDYADFHLTLSRAFAANGQRQEQEAALSTALRLNPRYVEGLLEMAWLLYETGRREEAISKMHEAIDIDCSCDGEHFRLAIAQHSEGAHGHALENLRKITRAVAGSAGTYIEDGNRLAAEERFAEAADAYDRALAISPRFADIRCRLGEALLQLDQVERAAEQFRIALDINPRYVEAHAQLGIALKRMRLEKEAREAFKAALELDPHHIVANFEVARR